jgi:dihydrofolate reductase
VLKFDEWPYGKKQVVVLSSRPSDVVAPTGAVCDAMSGTPEEVVRSLAERGLKHLYIDGGITIQRFLEAGMIQRMIITHIPVLLGGGIPLFGALSRDVRCQHVATRWYSSGMVQSEYTINPAAS